MFVCFHLMFVYFHPKFIFILCADRPFHILCLTSFCLPPFFSICTFRGVDPGFFRQMETLTEQVFASLEGGGGTIVKGGNDTNKDSSSSDVTNKRGVRIRAGEEEKNMIVEWAIPHDARVICAGLACVDMQLNQATGGDGGEGIETFQGENSIGGGRYVQRNNQELTRSTKLLLLVYSFLTNNRLTS